MTTQLEALVADSENRPIEQPIDWEKRYVDPHIMMKWSSAIEVIPACREKGIMHGMTIYPNGQRVPFYLT